MTLTRLSTGLVFHDDFNRADGAPGEDYAVDSGPWQIVGNKLSVTMAAAAQSITVVKARALKDVHVQVTARRTSLLAYAAITIRDSGSPFFFLGDTGASDDGNPNKPRVYGQVSGSYFLYGNGATGQSGAINTDVLLQFGAFPGEQRLSVNGTNAVAATDTNPIILVRGQVKLQANANGSSGHTVTFEDLFITNSRVVSCNNLPAGAKIRVGGVGGRTSAAETNGLATVDMLDVQMPAVLDVLDASNVVIDTFASTYGGDDFLYVTTGVSLSVSATGLLFADDFNRADGAPGANYTIESGSWDIFSKKLRCISTAGGETQLRLSGLADRVDMHVQATFIRSRIDNYITFMPRRKVSNNTWFVIDVGGSGDGSDPSKSRLYRYTSGYTRIGGGVPASPYNNVPQRQTASVIGTTQHNWFDEIDGGSAADATSANLTAGQLAFDAFGAGGSGTIYIKDLVVCASRTVTGGVLPAGYKIKIKGILSGASDGVNPVTLDIAGTELPAPYVALVDGTGRVVDAFVSPIYAGDTILYTPPNNTQLTSGGGSINATGTLSDDGAVALISAGGGISAVGTIELDGVIELTTAGGRIAGLAGEQTDNPYHLGRREVTADFATQHIRNISTIKRPDAISFDYLMAFSLGPPSIGNISAGVLARAWYVRADNANQEVLIARANATGTAWLPETVLFSFSGTDIEEIDLAFDQSGNSVVCMERKSGAAGAKEVWLYWFKPSVANFVLENFGAGRTPRILLDNPPDTANSDVILFYLKPTVGLVYRVQRELYAIAHATPHVDEPDWYVEDAFYTKGYRVAVYMVKHNPGGTYGHKRLESSLMPVYTNEGMTHDGYIVDGAIRVTLFIFTDDLASYPGRVGPTLRDDYITYGSTINAGSGTLAAVVLTHVLHDVEALGYDGDIDSAALTDLGINFLAHTLYDVEALTHGSIIAPGGNTLASALVLHTLYDVEKMTHNASFGAGGTLA